MKYIIIGNGVAGTAAAINIRKIDHEGEITILSDEAYPFYSRIRLMEYISGDVDESSLVIYKDAWYKKNNIKLLLNTPVSEIDKNKKEVLTHSGHILKYDTLLIAAGGLSFVPPIPGSYKKGVFTLRTLKDAIEIKKYAEHSNRVVLIGGGVLGLEAGNSLRKTGHSIFVVEFFPRLLPRQMDQEGADILKTQMEKMGFAFFLGAKTREIAGDDKVKSVALEDGTIIDCDMVLISAGVRPNIELANKLGIKCAKGLPVNERLETEIKDIYAAGDIAEHKGICYGIWPAAEEQGKIAGINMAGGSAIYSGTVPSNILKIAGINLISAGDIDPDKKCESIVQKDGESYIYKKLVIKDNSITGCILYGDIAGWKKVKKAMDEKKDISNIKTDIEEWNMEPL
ncbi:MAG: pyridine nucleotide-disulfide oxidoreductase [Nitrospirae bacterium GWF2_44_13]|nr:MAG: pyridine nucleotide-disulfide oxidoreductase [Nitrospirae bacterium GWF2_44_13]OGW63933.1 MAG: pyridine nucleotide-disulfide oxidoreductase [Nitrospirae bacterium RIFOXYA2_FULL_44_9]HBG93516.1 NAD(P)/FAD-dependent oxidoreductase [Nitrospiraceae bacterium]